LDLFSGQRDDGPTWWKMTQFVARSCQIGNYQCATEQLFDDYRIVWIIRHQVGCDTDNVG
jgi:hypothetical protein